MMRIFVLLVLAQNFLWENTLESKSFLQKLSDFNKKNIETVKEVFDNFYEVEPGKLYRSKQLTGGHLDSYIKKYGIKSVINLRGINKNKKWWQNEKNAVLKNEVDFYNISMSAVRLPGRENILKLMKIYDHAKYPILVHCQGGADRTGLAVAFYKILQGESNKKALEHLALRYGHRKHKNGAMDEFIKMCEGRDWVIHKYNSKNYPALN